MAIFLGFLCAFIPIGLFSYLFSTGYEHAPWILLLLPVFALGYLFFPFEKMGIGHKTIQGANTDPIFFTASLVFFAFLSYHIFYPSFSCKILQTQFSAIDKLQHDFYEKNKRYIQSRKELEEFSSVFIHKKIEMKFYKIDDNHVTMEVSIPQCDTNKDSVTDLLIWSSQS